MATTPATFNEEELAAPSNMRQLKDFVNAKCWKEKRRRKKGQNHKNLWTMSG